MFDRVLVVDWSSRGSPSPSRPSADALWVGMAGEEPRYFRTRAALVDWLGDFLAGEQAAGRRVLAGFDFAFGYPAGFAAAVCGEARALALWGWLAGRVLDGPDNANNRFEVAAAINARLPGVGPFWGRPSGRLLAALPEKGSARVGHGFAERREVEQFVRGAQPVWKLYTTGSVGGQVLTGLPALERLRRDERLDVAVWPFESGFVVPEAPVVFAEIYPSMLAEAARARGGIRDAAQVMVLAEALARLDRAGLLARLFSPEGSAVAAREEGWILGAGFGLAEAGWGWDLEGRSGA